MTHDDSRPLDRPAPAGRAAADDATGRGAPTRERSPADLPTPTPRRYGVRGLPAMTYLCFRTEEVDGRELLSLIPDSEDQHPFDVASIFLDNPDLYEVDPVTGEPPVEDPSVARKLADREACLDAIEVALFGDLYGADREDFLARIEELKRK